MLKLASRRALGLTCVALLAAVGLWAPAFKSASASGWGDWQQFHHWWEVGVVAIRRWGEWPLFDPHHCGGVSQWGQPQAQNFSPLYLVIAVPLGTTLGHKLFIVIHHVIGFTGLYVLARRDQVLSREASALAAMIWTATGFCAWHFAGGHSTFLAFMYIPWLLVCWRRADRDVRYTVGVAAIMTEMFLEGGTYPVPFAMIVLAFDAIARVRRQRWRPLLRTMVVSGALTGLLAALRWVPILITMIRYPRPTVDTDAVTFAEVIDMWTLREHEWTVPGHEYVWAEYGTFVGWGVLALCAIGVVVALWRRRFMPLFGAVFFLALSMGHHGPLWPASLLHRMPLYGSLRVSTRWQVICTLYMGLLAAFALHALGSALARWLRPRWTRWIRHVVPAMVLLAIAADMYSVGLTITDRWTGPPIGIHPVEKPHLVSGWRYGEEYANYPSRNVGSTGCYDNVPWNRASTLWVGELPQLRFVDPGTSRARSGDTLHAYDRTNHTVTADVTLATPGRIVLNQNYEPRWMTSTGAPVDDLGRLAVDLPAGRRRVKLWFAPDDLPWSVLASAAGVIACAAILARPWRRRRRVAAPRAHG